MRVAAAVLAAILSGVLALVLVLIVVIAPAQAPDDSPALGACGAPPVVAAAAVTVDGPAAGGLTAEQTTNARIIVGVGRQLAVPDRGLIVALATSLQESGLKNISYGDRDSLGLFQQRAPWGPAADRTDPPKSAEMFYQGGQGGQRGLLDIAGWQGMTVWKAAQSVQVSAFPTAYAKWEGKAIAAVAAITAEDGGPVATALPAVVECTTPETEVVQAAAVVTGPWTQPMAPGSYVRTSKYGMRTNPVSGVYKLHGGTDLAAPPGADTTIRAAAAGTVKSARLSGGFGNLTVIDHGGGVETYYAHQSRVVVQPGQQVTPGQVIGYQGTTGNSTGPHLHFEVHVNGQRTDPVPFMTDRGAAL